MKAYIRKLNAMEMISWIISQKYPHSISTIAHIKGRLNKKKLTKAVETLQQSFLLLNVNTKITNNTVFLEKISSNIPIEIVPRKKKDDWKKYSRQELHLPFNNKQLPLARFFVICDDAGFDILFTFHHMIADGLAGIWAIKYLLNLMSTNPNKLLGISRKPINKTDLQGIYIKDYPQVVIDKLDTHKENVTHFRHFSLNAQTTMNLLNSCKLKNISIHSAISAAACIALYESMDTAEKITMRYSAPANLRPHYHINSQAFSALSSWIDCNYFLSSETLFLELAKLIGSDLKSKIQNNEHVENVKTLYDFLNHNSINKIFSNVTTLFPTALVSNLGRLDIAADFDPYQLVGIHEIGNCQQYLASPNAIILLITNFNNENFFNLCYPKNYLSLKKAKEISNAIIVKLKLLSENFI